MWEAVEKFLYDSFKKKSVVRSYELKWNIVMPAQKQKCKMLFVD
jgi:hypothetical protein